MQYRYRCASSSALRGHSSRRAIVRNALGLAAATALGGAVTIGAGAVAAQQTTTPDSTVELFYADVATYQYEDAYALLSSELQAKQSFDAFTKGYADTAFVQAQIVGNGASAGQQDVQVDITAWHNDGSIHAYSGSYTLKQVGGDWKIAAAPVTEDAPPQNVAPLMRFADLDVSLGRPGVATGHIYSPLLVTNHTQSTVMAAGVPHLKVLDASSHVVIESTPGAAPPITAVALQPGETANATFEWANWCKAAPATPLKLQIAIPGDTHELVIPYATSSGSATAPHCFGSAGPSTFECRAFQAGQRFGS